MNQPSNNDATSLDTEPATNSIANENDNKNNTIDDKTKKKKNEEKIKE